MISSSPSPMVARRPKVEKDQVPIKAPRINSRIPIGSLIQKRRKALLKLSRPTKKKPTKTRLAKIQAAKNCQERWDGGGQNRKLGRRMVRMNRMR